MSLYHDTPALLCIHMATTQYVCENTDETQAVAQAILERVGDGVSDQATIITLKGELGAGKTTFTQALARELGITESVTSPTYVIEQRFRIPGHDTFKTFVHVDAYRLESGRELADLGWREVLANPANLVCLEWPERVPEVLPRNRITVTFEVTGESSRKLIINDERANQPTDG